MSPAKRAPFKPYFEPSLLEANVYGSDKSVNELYTEVGVYISEANVISRSRWAGWRSSEFIKAVMLGNLDAVQNFLKRGANPNKKFGKIPALHLAAGRGHPAVARLLLAAGAKIDALSSGMTPLAAAAGHARDHAVKELIRHGANLNLSSGNGLPPLVWAAKEGHLGTVRLLVAAGADIAVRVGSDMRSALHWAADRGHEGVVEYLLNEGAGANWVNVFEEGPLHLASQAGHAGIVEQLLRHGAELSARTVLNETASSLAQRNNQEVVLQVLAKWSAGPT